MKKATYLICTIALTCFAVVLTHVTYADDAKAPAVQLLEVGDFHGDEVNALNGEQWLGLYLVNGEYKLLSSILTIEAVEDELIDYGAKEPSGKKVGVNWSLEPIFLLKGANLIENKTVTTIFDEQKQFDNKTVIELKLGERNYILKVISDREYPFADTGKGSALVLIHGATTQTLGAFPDVKDVSDTNLSLRWAGDLDGDGKLDLYVDLSSHYNGWRRTLFLSSQAGSGNLLRKIASFNTTGC